MLISKGAGGNVNSQIGKDAHFIGKFVVEGILKIEGKFEGEILQANHIIIGPEGKVKTNIEASNVDIEGLLIGNIKAKNRIFLRPNSIVFGNIQAKELIIQNGVLLEGKCFIGNDLKQESKDKMYEHFETATQ